MSNPKINLADQTNSLRQIKQEHDTDAGSVSAASEIDYQPAEVLLTAYQLVGIKNLLALESSTSGVNYCWSGAAPEIQFHSPLERGDKLEMQIRLFALIKSSYSKKLKVWVDGKHIKHLFTQDDSLFVVSCILLPSSNTNMTDIKIGTSRYISTNGPGKQPEQQKTGYCHQ